MGFGVDQDFRWIKYGVGFSATGSHTDEPNDYQWQFNQESDAINATVPIYGGMPLSEFYNAIKHKDSTSVFHQIYIYGRKLNERTKTLQFNFEIPYAITNQISGYVKTGAKFKWLTREYDQEQWGRSGMAYGGYWNGVGQDLARLLSENYPNDFNYISDSIAIAARGNWILPRVYRGYATPSNFLGGNYNLSMMPDLRLMQEVMDVFPSVGNNNWNHYSIGSLGNDYHGIEQYQAAYIMAEIKLGTFVIITPGVRYDADYTKYHGQTFQAASNVAAEKPPIGYKENDNERKNNFLLPMVHIKIEPVEWLRLHIAGTETVTRPDFKLYAPITTLDNYGNDCQAANGTLKDSRSKNLDVSLSVHQEHVGLITVSGFYKRIDDLIMYEKFSNVNRPLYNMLPIQINAPINWFKDPVSGLGSYTPSISTYINNPSPAQYRGVELDWQTNFWYLPSIFKGLVFNLNWTYIVSEIETYRYLTFTNSVYDPITDSYNFISWIERASRVNRMPDQPAHILNTTIGYDYKGFSIRVSYLYQSDKFVSFGDHVEEDQETAAYGRWDISAQQKLTENIQLYANLNNINNTHDVSLVNYNPLTPASLQYYGQTIDVGLRVNF
jgi:TonB-dependent receptor